MSTFRLTRLLQLRQMKADQAAQDLALSHRRANQAQNKVDRAQEHVFGTELDVSPAVWQAVVAARLANMTMAKEAATAAQVAKEHTVVAARALDQARQHAKPLEKLQEKFDQEQVEQDLAAQAVVLDEVGQNMFRSGASSQPGLGGPGEL